MFRLLRRKSLSKRNPIVQRRGKLEALEDRRLLVATPIDLAISDNPSDPVDNTANITSIVVGGNTYSNLIAPNDAALENVPPEAFDPFWGSAATAMEPTDALDALGGFDVSNGVLNPNTEGPANVIFSQPITDLDGTDPELFIFNPDDPGSTESWMVTAITGGTAAAPSLAGVSFSFTGADFGDTTLNGSHQRNTGANFTQGVYGVAIDLGDLAMSGQTIIGLQVITPDGDPSAILGRIADAPLPTLTGGTGPGGVSLANGASNLENWFRADAGVVDGGSGVSEWQDQSGRNDHATALQAGGPTVVNSPSLNNQPTLRFDGSAEDSLAFTGLSHGAGNDFSFFAVIQPEDGRDIGTAIGFFLGSTAESNDSTKIGAWNSGGGFFRRIGNGGPSDAGTWPGVAGTTEPGRIMYLQRDSSNEKTTAFDGASPSEAANDNEVSQINRIGGPTNSADSQDWPGDIAELAFFSNTLNTAERHIVANYLSAKYNLPIDTGAGGIDVYSGDDPGQGDYDLDAFGIGRTDSGNISDNAGAAGFGFDAVDATLGDGEFVMAGHNTPVNGTTSVNVPFGVGDRWERVWYVDTNSSTIDAQLAFGFDHAGLTAPPDGVDYSLLRATTDGGPFTILDTQASAGGRVTFDVTSLQSGYYTLGVSAAALVVSPDAFDADENTPLNVPAGSGVLANDSLPPGAALASVQGTPLAGGSATVTTDRGAPLTLNDDGSFSYDPSGVADFFLQPGDTQTDTFTYVVNNSGTTASATVTITVTGQFGAIDDAYSTLEAQVLSLDAAGGLLANDPLPGGASLASVQGTPLAGGSVSVLSDSGAAVTVNDDGSFDYDPTGAAALALGPGETIVDSFVYTVDEGTGDSITATVNVTVTGNAGPIDDVFATTNQLVINAPPPGVLQNDPVVGASAYVDAVSASDPLIHWRLGETDKSDGATAANSAVGPSSLGAAADGTYHNTVGIVGDTAIAGTDFGASFGTTTATGSTGDRVQVDFGPIATPFPSSLLSIEIWLRSSSTANLMAIVSSDAPGGNNNESLLFLNGNSLNYYVNGNDVPTGVTRSDIIDGNWHHLVVTYDAGAGANNLVTYVDGVPFTNTTSGAVPDNGVFVLAQESDSPGGGFDNAQKFIGDLDEFALYDRALSQAEVQAHFDAAPVGSSTPVLSVQGTPVAGGTATVTTAEGASLTLNEDGSFSYDPTVSASLQALPIGASATDTFTYTIDDGNNQLESAIVTINVLSALGALNDANATDEDTSITAPAPGVLANDRIYDYVSLVQDADPVLYWRLGEADKSDGQTAVNAAGGPSSLGTAADGTYRGAVGNVTDAALGNSTDTAASFGTTAASGGTGDRVVRSDFTGTFPNEAFTIESWVRGTVADNIDPTLFSYAVSDNSNEFLLISQEDTWRIFIDNTARDTGIPESALLDGEWHHVAVSWDSVAGISRLHVDGLLVHTETNHELGSPINATGSFAVAQEQDSADGGFANDQKFVGDLDEVAVYSTVLQSGAIQAHFLAGPGQPTQITSFDATSALGAAVTVNPDGSYSYDPSGSATLNALSAGDAPVSDTFTYTIQGDAGSLLLAYDGFFTTEDGAGNSYDDEANIGGGPGADATANTVGFSGQSPWFGDNTAIFRPDNDDAGGGLTHNLVGNEQPGLLKIRGSHNREIARPIVSEFPATDNYRLSVLLEGDGTTAPNPLTIGLGDNDPDSRVNGIYTGFDGDDLIVIAGGQTTVLVPNFTPNTTYLVVLDFTPNPTGEDLLTASVAVDGAATLTEVFADQSVNAFGSVDDYNHIKLYTDTLNNGFSANYHWFADEFTLTTNVPPLIDSASVVVAVAGVNDAPTAVNDTGAANEDGPAVTIDLAGNDSDPDVNGTAPDDVLTVATVEGDAGPTVTLPSGAEVTISGGSISYDPNGAFEDLADTETTVDTFSYTISDGNGGTATAMVTVTITGMNDAPNAVDDTPTVNEDAGDTVIDVMANDSDPDVDGNAPDDTFTVTAVDDTGTVGSVVVSAGGANVTYNPNGQFETLPFGATDTDTFTYTITDNNGAAATATVVVTIEGAADAPDNADAGGPYATTEGVGVSFSGTFTDPDIGDTHTFQWTVGGQVVATAQNPTIAWADLLAAGTDDGPGTFDVVFTVTDAGGLSDSATATLDIANAPPAAAIAGVPSSATPPTEAVLGIPVDFTLLADDPSATDDANDFTYHVDWGDGVQESLAGPMSFQVSHEFQNFGTVTVTVVAEDKDGGTSAPVTHTIEIVPIAVVNDDLQATGTPGSDVIIFYPVSGGVKVRYNNVVYPLDGSAYSFSGSIIANGEAGSDRIIMAHGINIPGEIDGGEGNDYLTGGVADDTLTGGDGNDIMLAGDGNNYFDGGADNDRMEGRDGVDVMFGGDGNDRLNGGGGNDILHGGEDNDFIFGGLDDDLMLGGGGFDTIQGHYGNDVALGGAGSDQIFGGYGQDLLMGGVGRDRVRGDAGDDDLIGGTSALDASLEAALDAMLASLGTDLPTADLAVNGNTDAADAVAAWFGSSGNNRAGFGAFDDSDASDDLAGGSGTNEFHSFNDGIRDFRSGDGIIP